MTDFKKLKVVELRAELSKRGLPTEGKKDELIERLEEHEFQNADPTPSEMDIENEQPEVSVHPSPQIQAVSEPVIPSTNTEPVSEAHIDTNLEEEKRRARAIRFGLNPDEVAKVDISVTIHRLEHALPSRSRGNWKHRKHHNRVVKH